MNRRIARCLLYFAFAAGASCWAETITSMKAVTELSHADAIKAMPVNVTGVVTMRDHLNAIPEWLVLDDGIQAVWVEVSIAMANQRWKGDTKVLERLAPGDEVKMDGVTDHGGYAAILLPNSISKLGTRPLPAVSTANGSDLGCQRVELRGVVQSVRFSKAVTDRIRFAVRTPGQTVSVFVDKWPDLAPEKLIDAEVRMVGVYSPVSHYLTEMGAMKFYVAGAEDVQVVKPPRQDPFAAPHVPLDRLQSMLPQGRNAHRCVTEGVVTFTMPGDFFFIQQGDVGVKVRSAETNLKVGDRVEVAGFPAKWRLLPSLVEAVTRRVGDESPPEPLMPTSRQLTHPHDTLDAKEIIQREYDARLVKLKCRLGRVELRDSEDAANLTFHTDTVNASGHLAHLSKDDAAMVKRWEAGSEIEVTGVCETAYLNVDSSEIPKVAGFRLYLRSPQDVRIVAPPTWWTSLRLAKALVLALIALLFGLCWILVLRYMLRKRTQRLEEVMTHHRNAELEFQAVQQERRRLAIDLHDGLQQSLVAAAFQLELGMGKLSSNPKEAESQLTAARLALTATEKELRDCLWSLREVEEGAGDFAAVLTHAMASSVAWRNDLVKVEVSGEKFDLSRDVMGGLLMLVREAVLNAVRHGKATTVTVKLFYAEDKLTVSVQDNGVGFDVAAASGTREGHFGLAGMKQRMAWLGGTLVIKSAPEKGTCICASVPTSDRQRLAEDEVCCRESRTRRVPTEEFKISGLGLKS